MSNKDKPIKAQKTVGLGVKIDQQLKEKIDKVCNDLKHSKRVIMESLITLFLSLDKDLQTAIVRGEVKVDVKEEEKGKTKLRSILSLLI